MKSFQLDKDSIRDAIESWPAVIIAVAVFGIVSYFGWFVAMWRATLIGMAAVYFGYVFRGMAYQKLRSQYPNASHISLLSIGMCACIFGVLARMLFPHLQGGVVDYTWLSISFTTILAFVVINRRDKDVLK